MILHYFFSVIIVTFSIMRTLTILLKKKKNNKKAVYYSILVCFIKILMILLQFKQWLWLYLQRRQWHPTPVLLPGKSHGRRSLVGCSPWGREESDATERLHFHFSLHALEKEMATHSSVLAWRIPGMGEPGGLPSLGSHRVGHDWSDLAAMMKRKKN